MSETTFTRGPWEWFEDALFPVDIIKAKLHAREVNNFDDDLIWQSPIIETDGGHYGPNGADRSLISASPDLYAALKAHIEWWETDGGRMDEIIAQSRAALAKVENSK